MSWWSKLRRQTKYFNQQAWLWVFFKNVHRLNVVLNNHPWKLFKHSKKFHRGWLEPEVGQHDKLFCPKPFFIYQKFEKTKLTFNKRLQSVTKFFFCFFWFDLIVYFCRLLTKRRRESNPGRPGGKRERFLCAMPSPLRPTIIFHYSTKNIEQKKDASLFTLNRFGQKNYWYS